MSAATPYLFQSAPLTEARGDENETINVISEVGFNPLPSPKQGETPHTEDDHGRWRSFNPLPSPKQGETQA